MNINNKKALTPEELRLKKLKCFNKNEVILTLIFKIFHGNILKKDLQKLCFKYHAVKNPTEFEDRLNEMINNDLLDIDTISDSRLHCLHIKDFAVKQITGKKTNIKKLDTDTIIESTFKTKAILNNELINNVYKNLKMNVDLDSENNIVKYLIENTLFWTKEKSTVQIYDWLSDKYGITTDTEIPIALAKKGAHNRNKSLPSYKGESDYNKVIDSLDSIMYVDTISFGNIRDVNGYLSYGNFDSYGVDSEKGIHIDLFQKTEGTYWEVSKLGECIAKILRFSTWHINDVNNININIYYRENSIMFNSFEESTAYVTKINVTNPELALTKKIAQYSKNKFVDSIDIKDDYVLDSEKFSLQFNYKAGVQMESNSEKNKLDRNVSVKINYISCEIQKEVYLAETTDEIIKNTSTKQKEKESEKKIKARAINKLTKLEEKNKIDRAFYLQKYNKKQLERLDRIMNLPDDAFDIFINQYESL